MTTACGIGARSRYANRFGGDYLDVVRARQIQPGLYMPTGMRFCETCQCRKPKGSRKAVKGWKCDDCLRARQRAQEGRV